MFWPDKCNVVDFCHIISPIRDPGTVGRVVVVWWTGIGNLLRKDRGSISWSRGPEFKVVKVETLHTETFQ